MERWPCATRCASRSYADLTKKPKDLPNLSAYSNDELRELRLRIDVLIGSEPERQLAVRDTLSEAYYMLSSYMAKHGERSTPASVAMRMSWWKSLADNHGHLIDLVTRFKPKSEAARQLAAYICLSSLARFLERQKAPVTYASLARNLGNCVAALDSDFPGYAVNNLLPMLIRREKQE